MRSTALLPVALAIVASLVGCSSDGGTGGEQRITGRYWVSHVPRDEREAATAFYILPPDEGPDGIFIRGSEHRYTIDRIELHPTSEGTGTIEVLQDRRSFRVRGERCDAPPTFDYCLRLRGDPMRVGRYLSKREWEDDSDSIDVERLRTLLRDPDAD